MNCLEEATEFWDKTVLTSWMTITHHGPHPHVLSGTTQSSCLGLPRAGLTVGHHHICFALSLADISVWSVWIDTCRNLPGVLCVWWEVGINSWSWMSLWTQEEMTRAGKHTWVSGEANCLGGEPGIRMAGAEVFSLADIPCHCSETSSSSPWTEP